MNHPVVPPGFIAISHIEPFVECIGPLYVRNDVPDTQLGFIVASEHEGRSGCHPGVLCTLVDIAVSRLAQEKAKSAEQAFQTLSLSFDFFRTAPIGSWVTARAEVVKQTGQLLFVKVGVLCDGEQVLGATCILQRIAAQSAGI